MTGRTPSLPGQQDRLTFAGPSNSMTENSDLARSMDGRLDGKRVAMVLFSYYSSDPRPRRAAEALVEAGMTVDLISLQEETGPTREVMNGVNVRRVPIRRNRGGVLSYFYQYSAFLLACFAIFGMRSLKRRYDVFYVHNMPDFLVFSALIPKILGAKVVLDLHDPMPELMMTIFGLPQKAKSVRLLELVERWSIGFADAVVTVNRACAKLFASRSCALEKITVVMNSPDEKIFKFRSPVPRDGRKDARRPFIVMYHGSLVERNGLDLAVEAMAKIHASIPSAQLRVYGQENSFLKRVMDSARRYGLEDVVHYLGSKPVQEIAKAIEECDLGIIPNQRSIFTELNTPTRIFEYLALGKPVIAPRAPGICDYFGEESLFFFELGSAEDLARKIEHVFHNPDQVTEIVKRGQVVHRTHMWGEERQRLTGLVAELLRDNNTQVESAIGVTHRRPTGNS
jgi:glycosyltransferase involved in cell wall biosynthesis